ncbi:MAG: TldD/PmbA family protein, partial [Candidatus Hodarchaeales archaeon]
MGTSTEQLVELAHFAIQEASKAGMDGAFVNANINRVISTRFARSAIPQNFIDHETKPNINVIKGQKRVLLTRSSTRREDISWAVDRATRMIRSLPDDPTFPGMLMKTQDYPNLELNDPSAKNLNVSDVTDKIVASIHAAHDVSGKVQSVSGNTNLRDGFDYYLSSEGHEVITPITRITSVVNVMANDIRGESRSNSSFGERRFAKLPLEAAATDVAERAVLGLNPKKIEPRTYSVVLDHQAAARQMFLFGIALSAKSVLDQASFLKDKIGEKVSSDSMTFVNDPHNPELLSSRALDWEGVASKSYTLVRNGILENYAHDRLSARQMGAKTNGCCLISEYGSFPFPFACA